MPSFKDILGGENSRQTALNARILARKQREAARETEKENLLRTSRANLAETGIDTDLDEIKKRKRGETEVTEDRETGTVRKRVSWRDYDWKAMAFSRRSKYDESSVSVTSQPDGTIVIVGEHSHTIKRGGSESREKERVDQALGDAYTKPEITHVDEYIPDTSDPNPARADNSHRRPKGGW